VISERTADEASEQEGDERRRHDHDLNERARRPGVIED
jgi:hypothetical protein